MDTDRFSATPPKSLLRPKPPIRWAGGKYRLTSRLLEQLPPQFNRLIEPFAGSAALFFAIQPREAVLADINSELINFYETLAFKTEELIEQLMGVKASKSLYYRFRNAAPKTRLGRAIKFSYLNRLCWNGLYRVNSNGTFNVPMGDRLPKTLWHQEHLTECASALRRASFRVGDFEDTFEDCRKGDFVYLGPPYPKGAKEGLGFNKYHFEPFSIDDHERVADFMRRLDKKGVKIVCRQSQMDKTGFDLRDGLS